MGFQATLYVDLAHTALENFSYHFNEKIEQVLHGNKADIPKESMRWDAVTVDDAPTGFPWPEQGPSAMARNLTYYFLKATAGDIIFMLAIEDWGKTCRYWTLFDMENAEDSDDAPAEFLLIAKHYHSDVLNITMYENADKESLGGSILLGWIQQHWRKGWVVDLLKKGEIPADLPDVPRSGGGRPRIKAHADAIERLKAGEYKMTNFNSWQIEYEEETKTPIINRESSPEEIYRKSVWNPFMLSKKEEK